MTTQIGCLCHFDNFIKIVKKIHYCFEWDAGNTTKVAGRLSLTEVEDAFMGGPAVFYDEKHALIESRWILTN